MSDSNVVTVQESMAKALSVMLKNGTVRSCLNCEHFRTYKGVGECTNNPHPVTPPPKVIFYGCRLWEQEIPF